MKELLALIVITVIGLCCGGIGCVIGYQLAEDKWIHQLENQNLIERQLRGTKVNVYLLSGTNKIHIDTKTIQ